MTLKILKYDKENKPMTKNNPHQLRQGRTHKGADHNQGELVGLSIGHFWVIKMAIAPQIDARILGRCKAVFAGGDLQMSA